MPRKTVHCRVCGAPISGYDFQERMEKLRRHYKRHHPKLWKKSVAKAIATKRRRGIISRRRKRR